MTIDATQEAAGRHEAVIAALIARAEATGSTSEAAELYAQAGFVADTLEQREGEAFQLYLKALGRDPTHPSARDAALRIAEDPLRPVAGALEALEDLGVAQAALGLSTRLGLEAEFRLQRNHTGDGDLARALLEEALEEQEGSSWPALLLRDQLEDTGDLKGLAELVRAEARRTSDATLSGLLWTLTGKLAEDRGDDPEEAALRLGEALEAEADNPALHVAVGRCLRRQGDVEALAIHLEAEAQQRRGAGGRLAAAVEAATVCAWRLGDPARGLATLQRALSAVVTDPRAAPRLKAELRAAQGIAALLAREVGEEAELVELRDLVPGVEAPGRRAAVLTRIAQLLADRRATGEGSPKELAAQYLESALEADPEYRSASLLLDDLVRADGDAEHRRELLTRRGRAQARPELLVQAAELCLEELEAPAEALALIDEAVSRCDEAQLLGPGSPLALMRHPSWPLTAETVDAWIQIGERAQLRLRSRPGLRRMLERLAELALSAGLIEQATEVLAQVVDLEPEDAYARQRLAAILERCEDHAGLVELRRQELALIDAEGSDARSAAARVELARLFEQRLDAPEEALRWYDAALEQRPGDLEALVGAGRLLIQQGLWGELARLYEAELTTARTEATRASLAFRLAWLSERNLGDAEGAARWYERVLERDRDHLPSLLGLLRVEASLGRWPAWVTHMRTWADRAGDDVLAAALLCELGEVCEEELGDQEEAAAAYRAALELQPKLEPAWQGLVRTLYVGGDEAGACEVASLQLEQASEPLARLDVLATMAVLDDDERQGAERILSAFPEHLPSRLRALRRALVERDVARAAEQARGLMAILPGGPVRAAIERLTSMLERLSGRSLEHETLHELLGREHLDELTLLDLETMLRAQGDLEGVGQVMLLRARSAPDPVAQASYVVAWGRHLHARGLLDQASEVYQQALQVSPGYLPALKALKLLQEQQGDRDKLVLTYELEGSRSWTPELVVDNFLKASELRRRYLGDLDSAIADLEEVLRHDPAQRQAFESLREIFSMRGDPRSLFRLFERRAHAPIPVEERKEMLLKMAEIAFSRLGQNELAVQAHEQVLELDPGHIQSYRILAELHESAGRWAEAVEALVGVVGLTEDASLLARTYRSVAEIYDRQLGDVARATEAYRSLVRHAPNDLDGLRRLAELLMEQDQWEASARAYGDLLKRERRRSKLKGDLLALAHICTVGLREPRRAGQCLAQAARLDPFDLDIAQALVDHLREQQDWDQLNTHLLQTSRHFAGLLAEGLDGGDADHHAAALEGLFAAARWREDWDRAFVVGRVAELLGVETLVQRELTVRATRAPGAERLPVQPIPVDMTSNTIPPGLSASVLSLMRLTDSLIGRTFSASLRDLGATRRTRLSDRDRRAGAATLAEWPAIFSVQTLPLYVVETYPSAGRPAPDLVPGESPSLIVPDALLPGYGRGDAVALFELGCALAPASMGVGSWSALPDDLFAATLATIVQAMVPEFLAADPRLEHPRLDRDRLKRHILRMPDTALRPHALQVSGFGTFEPLLQQRRTLEQAFRRLALIPVYDPGPVLMSLERPHALDLVTLLLGERHGVARRAVGVAFSG